MFFLSRKTSVPTTRSYEQDFTLSDRILPLRVSESQRAKRLTLRIETGGKALRVTTPPATKAAEVMRFVERHRGWIESRIARLPPPQDTPMLKAGAFLPIFGIPHEIVHKDGRGTAEIVAETQDRPAHIIVYGDAAHLPRRLSAALIKQAEQTIAPLVAKHAATVGRKPVSIRYKDTKSRWGSCSADGHLSFSWRIIMAPKGVINYLVAHETAHLIEMNHSPRFWALCEKLCPESKRYQAWLKRNGQALHAIDFK
ncbi:M48 family metallopeptidase [Bartonella sp. LJL80]